MKFHFSSFLAFLLSIPFIASAQLLPKNFQQIIGEVEKECIDFRRHFHEFPELSNREFNTGKFIAERLRKEGLDVQHPVAKTGVVAVLTGGKPGPAIALRADIDALPITERTPVPFASKVKTTFNGQEVGVMHACGHDAHTAILMATAIALKRMQKEVPGTIVFLFQPAEEGAPSGEEGGAPLMIKEGLLDNPKVNAVFGLHMASDLPAGQITYKSGAAQASSDLFKITVKGKGSHGSMPWKGVDPIIVSAQILQALQTIVSRQEDLTKAPVVITVGSMHSGVRSNIIPETAEMSGTIRSLDEQMREDVHQRMRLTVKSIAESAGATADIEIVRQTLVNYNDPALTAKMIPSLMKAAGEENVLLKGWVTAAEDFSFYREKAPTFFFSLGGLAPNATPDQAGPHHTPDFSIDESGFIIGIKAFCQMVFDYSR